MKSKNNTIFIEDEIYGTPLYLIIGGRDFYKKQVEKLGAQFNESNNMGGETIQMENEKTGQIMNVVWMPSFLFDAYSYSTLVHELTHATLNTMNTIGFKFDYENHEPIAYYVDYLVRKSLLEIDKIYKKKR